MYTSSPRQWRSRPERRAPDYIIYKQQMFGSVVYVFT